MAYILLVRHAENNYTRQHRLAGRLTDVHLNQPGLEQSKALANTLANLPLKAIYSSPLERALETAQPLAEQKNLEIVPLPGLIEIDYGDWQGCSLKELYRTKMWKAFQQSPEWMCFPNGETLLQAQTRMIETIWTIAHQHEQKDWVVCVSHADPIKLALAYFLNMPLGTYQRLTIGLVSITTLYLDPPEARLISANYDPSLFDRLLK